MIVARLVENRRAPGGIESAFGHDFQPGANLALIFRMGGACPQVHPQLKEVCVVAHRNASSTRVGKPRGPLALPSEPGSRMGSATLWTPPDTGPGRRVHELLSAVSVNLAGGLPWL